MINVCLPIVGLSIINTYQYYIWYSMIWNPCSNQATVDPHPWSPPSSESLHPRRRPVRPDRYCAKEATTGDHSLEIAGATEATGPLSWTSNSPNSPNSAEGTLRYIVHSSALCGIYWESLKSLKTSQGIQGTISHENRRSLVAPFWSALRKHRPCSRRHCPWAKIRCMWFSYSNDCGNDDNNQPIYLPNLPN